MIDRFLEVGASFDWISPLASVLGDMMNGPSHTFLIPYDSSPLSGREIALMLGKRGVKSWGHMVVSGTLMVSVGLSQARWAQHLLEQAGVPLENPVEAQGHRRSEGSKRSKGRQGRRSGTKQRKSEMGSLLDSIDEIFSASIF